MRICLFLMLLIFCISCSSPEPEKVLIRDSNCPDFLIDRIHQTHANRTYTFIYTYDAEDRIIAIAEPENKLRTEWQYDTGPNPIKKEVFSVNGSTKEFIRENLYFYDKSNRLVKLERENEEVLYEYDGFGQVVKTYSRERGSRDKFLRTRIFWEEGHINKIEVLKSDGELQFEKSYTYDTECNPFYNSPLALENVVLQDPNNVIFRKFVDHTGLIDVSCSECSTTYEFNASGLPIVISTTRGATQEIMYK